MSKRVDQRQDATQEISGSQLLPNTPRPQIPRGNPQHDASMWMQTVVGSDDFAPAPKKKAATGGRSKWLVPVVVAGVLGAGAAGYFIMAGTQSARPSAATSPEPTTPPKPMAVATPAVAAPTAPAAPAAAPPAASPADAGLAAATSPVLVADAVSSVGAPIKKTTRKKATKKKVVKKKPAPKRR